MKKCPACNGVMVEQVGGLRFVDKQIGTYYVKNIRYFHCHGCNDIQLSIQAARQVERERQRIKEVLINRFPFSEFLPAPEAASLLEISRQALHKNRRISRGFIYQTELSGKTFYLKRSVLQFKSTSDGRFPLVPGAVQGPKYISSVFKSAGTSYAVPYSSASTQPMPTYTRPQFRIPTVPSFTTKENKVCQRIR